eukprot:CAMPEP_0194133350 /NCGR_PEP_ID=MMETSP0152-20130528/3563_1 /TAXON_ID=1049557 /ORGANISM="Thalassiothrix antarctica, Strain L6-D1" /LENGTH=104 /DNA_ID=CAMNT_0038828651 /DNA_START=45 /DNA_END=359 /DNA_ORIENTATION=+
MYLTLNQTQYQLSAKMKNDIINDIAIATKNGTMCNGSSGILDPSLSLSAKEQRSQQQRESDWKPSHKMNSNGLKKEKNWNNNSQIRSVRKRTSDKPITNEKNHH